MTILNTVVSAHRGLMFQDTSLYDKDFTIIRFDRKTYIPQSWNGVVGHSGNLYGLAIASHFSELFGSFDEFVEGSASGIRAEHEKGISEGYMTAQNFIVLAAIGWSESEDRPRAMWLHSDPRQKGEVYRWNEVEEFGYSVVPTAMSAWTLHRQGCEPCVDVQADGFDALKHGVPLVEAQRRQKSDALFAADRNGNTLHMIGGQLWVSEVTREGVTERMLKDWHDVVGEPIKPLPAPSTLPRIAPSHTPKEHHRTFWRLFNSGQIDVETMSPKESALARPRQNATTSEPPMNRQQRRALARYRAV